MPLETFAGKMKNDARGFVRITSDCGKSDVDHQPPDLDQIDIVRSRLLVPHEPAQWVSQFWTANEPRWECYEPPIRA
jgi:hypothetical protein